MNCRYFTISFAAMLDEPSMALGFSKLLYRHVPAGKFERNREDGFSFIRQGGIINEIINKGGYS